MRHRKTVHKINKQPAHRRALLRNLLTSFFKHEKVITTRAKAKAAQEVAERLIRYAISGTLADKRRIISYLRERDVAHKLIRLGRDNFARREHRGGFTAVYKYGYRKGDGAELAVLTLLVEELPKDRKKRKKKAAEPEVIEAVEAPAVAEEKEETSAAETETAPQQVAEGIEEEVKPESGAEQPEAVSEEQPEVGAEHEETEASQAEQAEEQQTRSEQRSDEGTRESQQGEQEASSGGEPEKEE